MVDRTLVLAHAQATAASLAPEYEENYELSGVLSSIFGRTPDVLGTGQYELLDPGWLIDLYDYLTVPVAPFPAGDGPLVQIADTVRLALAGDWATGLPAALAVAAAMRDDEPDHTIHLGDVYYAGSAAEVEQRFLAPWPAGTDPTAPSFAIPGNHEMYSGGAAYYNILLADPRFSAQQGHSYFALTNAHWLIIALDSAYAATDLYRIGTLGAGTQIAWAAERIAEALADGKGVIVLTHHPGLLLSPDMQSVEQTDLWTQVRLLCDSTGPARWYWGHAHEPIVFAPQSDVRCRCIGHGGIPYLPAAHQSSPVVEWAEDMWAGDRDEPRRACNGYLRLDLHGPAITETLVTEQGAEVWTAAEGG